MTLRDPVHFFDATGRSMLVRENLEAENARLTREVERLKQLVVAQQRKIEKIQSADEKPTILHS